MKNKEDDKKEEVDFDKITLMIYFYMAYIYVMVSEQIKTVQHYHMKTHGNHGNPRNYTNIENPCKSWKSMKFTEIHGIHENPENIEIP